MKLYQCSPVTHLILSLFFTLILETKGHGDHDYFIRINECNFQTGIIAFSEISDKIPPHLIIRNTERILEIETSERQKQKLNTYALSEVIESVNECRFKRRDLGKLPAVNGVALSQIIETLNFLSLNALAKNLVVTGGFTIGDVILADKKGLTIRFAEPSAWKLKAKFPDISYGKLRKWGYSINSFAKLIHEDSYWWSYPDINEIVQGGWTVAEIVESKAYSLREIINAFKYDKESFQKKDIKVMVSNYEEKTIKNTLGLTNIQFEYLKNVDEKDLDSLDPNEAQLLENEIDGDSAGYLLIDEFERKNSINSRSSQYPTGQCKPCVIL